MLLALDLESVLVPEIWIAVAERYQIPDLRLTTRDLGDYPSLMERRLALARQHGLTLARLREVVEALEPLPGAVEFLDQARRRGPVVVISDTFWELAEPLLGPLGYPLLLCHRLRTDSQGFIAELSWRLPEGKAGVVRAFQAQGYRVGAVGDSHNDLEMLSAAQEGVLFRPPAGLAQATGRQALETYLDLEGWVRATGRPAP